MRSHGESFLALLESRLTDGLFLLDEPESALSPKRQLSLLAMMAERVKKGKSQFIIATHSPILMTYPGATVVSFDSPTLESVDYRQGDHFLVTQGILDSPRQYWKHLRKP
jgi:predicted ATPase